MKRLASALLVALASPMLLTGAARSDTAWKDTRGWRIVASEEYVGCVASADYRDGTRIRIGFDGIIGKPFLNLSNPKFGHYAPEKNYELVFDAGRRGRFSGYFRSTERQRVQTFEYGGVSDGFLDALAAASAIRITIDGRLLTGVVLNGSRAAIATMIECQAAQR